MTKSQKKFLQLITPLLHIQLHSTLANLQLAFVLCLGKLGKYLFQDEHSCYIFIHPY